MNQIQVAAQSQVPAQPVPPFAPVQIGLSEESKLALLDHWRSIKKRKWPILGLATALAALGAAVAFSMTPVYKSTATVLIEPGKPKFLSMDDMFGSAMQSKEHYQTQVEILKSREVAMRTVTTMKLWNNPDFDPRKGEDGLSTKLKAMLGMAPPKVEWNEQTLADATVTPLMKGVTIEPVRLSQLVKVSFESPDSKLAARVANDIAANYIDADRDAKFKLAQNLNGWLEKRAAELRKNLEASELALQAYREEKGLVSLSGSAQALAGMQANEVTQRLVEARARRLQLEGTYNLIGGVGNGDYSGVPAVVNHPTVQEAIRQEAAAQKLVAELSENLGPNHIKMQEAQSSLAAARKYLEQQRRSVARSMVQEYNLARQSERSLEAALSTATGGVQDVNRKEFQLQVLEREVASNKQLYDLFMGRAKEMDAGSDIQAAVARVVDPAVVATVPVKPNKNALGRASRILRPRSPSWVRCASSTSAMMLLRSFRLPVASPNLKIVVMMILRTSWASNCCSFSRLSAFSRLGMSAPVNVPVIWLSRSMRSTTISTVGFFKPACMRSFCAAKTISRDLPEPWKCQIKPFLG